MMAALNEPRVRRGSWGGGGSTTDLKPPPSPTSVGIALETLHSQPTVI